MRGCTFAGVVLDHAAHCSIEARMALDYLRYRGFLVESNTTMTGAARPVDEALG
ncbi:MAG: hypothetical protein Q7U48_13830 [Hydrogenophaga sp.]|nr:hypothetical protein [Hydrogenophaga sp.]